MPASRRRPSCAIPGTLGYACSDPNTLPTEEYSLGSCSLGQAVGSDTEYCCQPPSSFGSTCSVDTSVTSCGTGVSYYTCSGTDAPSSTDSTLACGGSKRQGCLPRHTACQPASTASSTCSVDSTITLCGSAVGYTCTGVGTPRTFDPTLTCGPGVASGSGAAFCCIPPGSGDTQDASNVDAGDNTEASVTPDSSTSGDDATEESPVRPISVDTGNADCSACTEASCCNELVACDTPDDAGVDSTGHTQCEISWVASVRASRKSRSGRPGRYADKLRKPVSADLQPDRGHERSRVPSVPDFQVRHDV